MTAQLGEGQSRAGVQRWIKDGYVTRAGALEANPARKVRLGEVYDVDVPAAEASELVPEDIPLSIVYEDSDLLVIDKPAGLTVHPAPGNYTGTLVQALLHHCGDSLSGINGEMRPGIVHRIDKDTSGLLVVAKHDVAHRGLAKQFARHDIHRKYTAIVRGVPLRKSGTIEAEIGRNPQNRMKRAVVADGTGKPAITHYRLVEIFGDAAALVQCQLETGRTHQIRVHMSYIGHALLGDPMYGRNTPLKGFGDLNLPPRQLLHAAELGFVHPVTREEMFFESPLPADMEAVLKTLRS
ncbi:MAG: RluA family pseudouridine synthase [Alphaproteobacteria bacterium]|nr:MAG: RluA family pseudouridine synthase [Alphaproteobacteria bacterium]